MQQETWLHALRGIQPGTMTIAEFQEFSGLSNANLAYAVLRELADYGVGLERKIRSPHGRTKSFAFSSADRLIASILAIQNGCDIERVSAFLSWKDFEGLASKALASAGYLTSTNVRFRKPRMEIDVVGTMNGVAIAVDCKHWNRRNLSSLTKYCKKQTTRCSRLLSASNSESVLEVENRRAVKRVLPVVLTLYPERSKFVERVPVVSISQFRSFILDIDLLEENCFVFADQ